MHSIKTTLYYPKDNILGSSANTKDRHEALSEQKIISKEKIIFWQQEKKQELQLLENKFTKVKNIDKYHLNSIGHFISFSNSEKFKIIKRYFIDDIIKFESLVIFFLQKNNSYFNNDKISIFISKITNTENYRYYNEAIITLFSKTRKQIHTIIQILEQIKKYQQEISQLNTPQALLSIDISYVEKLISNSITDFDMCFDGVIARIDNFYYAIKSYVSGKSGVITTAKNNIITSFTAEFEENLIALAVKKRHSVMSIHYNTYLRNILANNFNLEPVLDNRANFEPSFMMLNNLKNKAELALSPMNIVNHLADNMYQELVTWLEKYNLSSWVNNALQAEDLPVLFTEDIQQNFIRKYNIIYNCCNTENELHFYTFINDISEGITPFFSINDAYIKLHAWIASALSDLQFKRIIGTSKNDSSLAIVAIGTCHFWIAETNIYNDHYDRINFENYQKLELKHIPIELFSNILLETARAIILQALQQTDIAEDIISFFSNPMIYDLLLLDEYLLESINQIISSKITANVKLKQQLVTIICNEYLRDEYQIQNNIKNSYWFIDSNLLEPILLQSASNGLDISPFLNQLTIKQILQLNNKFSLKVLYEATLKTTSNFLDSKHFIDLYHQLRDFTDSYAFTKIIHSGIVDDLLFDSLSTIFNKQMLFTFITNNDADGIELLARLNNANNNQEIFDINAVDEYGNTALMAAAINGYNKCIKALLKINLSLPYKKRIKPNKTMRADRCTALFLAAKKGSLDCIKTLFQIKNIDINIKNISGITPLMIAARTGSNKIVDFLIQHQNIDVITQDQKGRTALMDAVYSRNIKCVKSLIEFNDSIINNKNYEGYTALMCAAAFGEQKIVNLLLENNNINVNLQDKNGVSALMIAVYSKYVDCVESLVRYPKTNVNLQDLSGYSALIAAAEYNDNKIIDLLLNTENIEVNLKNSNGFSALLIASSLNNVSCLGSLINHKNIDINSTNNFGWTALMMVCFYGYTECLKLIIAHKNIKLNMVNDNSHTALNIASITNNKECKNMLKKYFTLK